MRINTATILLLLTTIIFAANINQSLFLWLQGWGRYVPPVIWASLTLVGDALTLFALLLLFARKYPRLVWSAILAGIVATMVVHGIKHTLAWPRPPAVIARDTLLLIGPEYRLDSFPSGHSAAIWTFAGVWLMSHYNRLNLGLLLVFASAVSLSRVMVGAHWPEDITTGALIGWLSAWAGVALAKQWQWGITLTGQRLIVTLLLIVAVSLIGFDAGYTQAKYLTSIIGIICVLAGSHQLYRLFRHPGRAVRHTDGEDTE